MATTKFYADQSSRRIVFQEDDTKSLIHMLAIARLSDEEDEGDLIEHTTRSSESMQAAKHTVQGEEIHSKENVKPTGSLSSGSGKTSTAGTRRSGLLGGSVRRVEHQEDATSTTPHLKSSRDSLKPRTLNLESSRLSAASGRLSTSSLTSASTSFVQSSQSDSSFIAESAIKSNQLLFPRRLIKTPIPLTSSPPSPGPMKQFQEKKASAGVASPAPSVSRSSKKGQVGWSPKAPSPYMSPIVSKRSDDENRGVQQRSPIEDAPNSPKFLDENYHEREYEYHRVLGTGSFGKVLLATSRTTKQLVAIKVLDRKKLLERANLRRAHCEIRCLENAGNNEHFIVMLKRAFETRQKIFIVQDFCVGGELFSLLQTYQRLSIEAVQFYAGQCAVALAHLHSKRFAYRDLKIENIMLDIRGNVRLVDFGLVKEGITHADRGARSFVGTTEYMAPELLSRRGHGFAVDWWALGVVIHELLTGLPPWYTNEYQEMQRRILEEPLILDPLALDPPAIATIAHLMDKSPMKRLGSTGDELATIRASPFFKSIDWEKLLSQSLRAPFVPDLDHESDLRYFSQDFLDLPVEV